MIPNYIPHLLTYPRSGSHYFDDVLYEEEQIHFTKSHYLDELFDDNGNKRRPIITIARDPIDSICSYMALPNGYNSDGYQHEFEIKEKITEYVLIYSFLCEHADYSIDFNDLTKYPKPVIKKILNLLNINKNTYNDFNREVVQKYKDFVPSSKFLPKYNNTILNNFDLSLCYYYYYKLLENKIVI
jgi:hypothetical protein